MEQELKLENFMVKKEKRKEQSFINISERPVKIIPERDGFKRKLLDKLFYSWRTEQ